MSGGNGHRLFKTEVIKKRARWRTVDEVELATARWVEGWNHRRLLGPAGDVPRRSLKSPTMPSGQRRSWHETNARVSEKPRAIHTARLITDSTGASQAAFGFRRLPTLEQRPRCPRRTCCDPSSAGQSPSAGAPMVTCTNRHQGLLRIGMSAEALSQSPMNYRMCGSAQTSCSIQLGGALLGLGSCHVGTLIMAVIARSGTALEICSSARLPDDPPGSHPSRASSDLRGVWRGCGPSL